jgi:hypothetical protein
MGKVAAEVVDGAPKPKIDLEFRKLLRDLRPEELNELTAKILDEGCSDPLVVWRSSEGDILLDGHHRLEICEAHGLAYPVRYLKFLSRAEARDWIFDNQSARRNWTDSEYIYRLGERYQREKRSHGGNRRSGEFSTAQNGHLKTTAELIATKVGGISPNKVRRAGEFKTAVDRLNERIPGSKEQILFGPVRPTQKDVLDLLSETDEIARFVVREGKTVEEAKSSVNKRHEHEYREQDETPIRELTHSVPIPGPFGRVLEHVRALAKQIDDYIDKEKKRGEDVAECKQQIAAIYRQIAAAHKTSARLLLQKAEDMERRG